MSAAEYRESLRRYRPHVYVDGRPVDSVADDPALAPGVNGIGVSYDFALRESTLALMRAQVPECAAPINRMLAIPRTSADLLNKLGAVRLLCQETGCAQRYLAGDALATIFHGTYRLDAEEGTTYHARLRAYVEHVYANDLTLGIAMTDAKGDRSLRPSQQPAPGVYVHIVERRADGIFISGTKAIVTAAPYTPSSSRTRPPGRSAPAQVLRSARGTLCPCPRYLHHLVDRAVDGILHQLSVSIGVAP